MYLLKKEVKIFSKSFKKTLDKFPLLWYNILVNRLGVGKPPKRLGGGMEE
jgi:hypothetical protein